jgi:4-aminobutyrate aminotransferase-like enzyme
MLSLVTRDFVVADRQVQSGFGRTGTHFWGYQGHGAKPDIGELTRLIGVVSFLFFVFNSRHGQSDRQRISVRGRRHAA